MPRDCADQRTHLEGQSSTPGHRHCSAPSQVSLSKRAAPVRALFSPVPVVAEKHKPRRGVFVKRQVKLKKAYARKLKIKENSLRRYQRLRSSRLSPV